MNLKYCILKLIKYVFINSSDDWSKATFSRYWMYHNSWMKIVGSERFDPSFNIYESFYPFFILIPYIRNYCSISSIFYKLFYTCSKCILKNACSATYIFFSAGKSIFFFNSVKIFEDSWKLWMIEKIEKSIRRHFKILVKRRRFLIRF